MCRVFDGESGGGDELFVFGGSRAVPRVSAGLGKMTSVRA